MRGSGEEREARPSLREKNPKPRRRWVNVLFFCATLVTVFWAGAEGATWKSAVENGLVYMASLMSILLAHELGHYFMARRNKVDASLPYFLPVPLPLVGTAGAVILMRGRIRSRDALMEVGAAGPLAGMAVALPLMIRGLSNSPVHPIPEGGLMEGQSLLYLLLKRVVVGELPPGHDVMLNPMAWAAWVGFLVTMLNLLPIGQLDGGHIFYALFGEAHRRASRFFHTALFALGAAVMLFKGWSGYRRGLEGEELVMSFVIGANWLVFGGFLALLHRKRGFKHPPTDDNRLSKGHRVVGFACLALLVLIFMPVILEPII